MGTDQHFVYTGLTLLICLTATFAWAQMGTVKVTETKTKNRIAFFAENRTFTDHDVLFGGKGTNF